MAREKKQKIDTKDYVNTPIELWNGTTFREYTKHLNVERGLPYIQGSPMLENQWIKQLVNEYGNENTKKFIELCVAEHKISDKFPTITIYFMKHFLLQNYMPRVLQVEIKKTKLQELREKLQEESKDVENYF